MNQKQTIIAIDPGSSGGIAVFTKSGVQAVKMPKSVSEMNDYFIYIKNTYENVVVFIEKVQAFSSDDDSPGKKFAINKMLANYQQVLTVVKLCGFKFIEVYPISWQTSLGLKIKGKEESKTERKNRYKDFSQNIFPELKVTLQTSDALCIIQFALLKIESDMKWIRERLQNVEKDNLFK